MTNIIIPRIFICCAAMLLLADQQSTAQQTSFSSEAVRADFDYLYQSLHDTHFNLYAYRDSSAYEKQYQLLKNSIAGDSVSYIETVTLFQHLVSFANTGHCEIDFPAVAYIGYAYTNGKLFPLELALENNQAFVRKNHSTDQSITPGDIVVSIDGVPVDSLVHNMYPLVSAEREYFKKAKIEFWSFPRLLFQLQGRKEAWSVVLKKADGSTREAKLSGITVMDYEQKRNGEILSPTRELRFIGNTAYLNPGLMNSPEDADKSVFNRFIDSAFAVILSRKTSNLVLDLRNNPGGHDEYSNYLVSYFANKPFLWYKTLTIKVSQILQNQTRSLNDTSSYYANLILRHKAGDTANYEQPLQQPMVANRRYKGKVYVLVNRQTYSMATVSAALIQDYKFGIVAGEETGDIPTLYASQFSYNLPQTGITVKVPKGYIVRPSGDTQLKGVVPQIKVADHLLDEKDEILEALLDRINKK